MSSGLPSYTPWQPTLPYGTLQESQEQQALCYFFSEFTAVPQHYSVSRYSLYIAVKNLADMFTKASRGYLEYLLPVYFDAAPQSPLFAALSATALAAFSNRPGRKTLMYNAQKMYLTAVALIQKAVADPIEAKMDTTIVSVLLLGIPYNPISYSASECLIMNLQDCTRPSLAQNTASRHGANM